MEDKLHESIIRGMGSVNELLNEATPKISADAPLDIGDRRKLNKIGKSLSKLSKDILSIKSSGDIKDMADRLNGMSNQLDTY